MALHYAIARETEASEFPKRGYCVIGLDSGILAKKIRVQKGRTPLHANEYLVEYTSDRWDINIGSNSFFFQEGQADKYAQAKYGGIRIDNKGNSILVGLYDANKKLLQ
nr:GDYXXLXY domain-containing protein [Paraflavitalea speifideiaquila]